jgi:hypothetical protein
MIRAREVLSLLAPEMRISEIITGGSMLINR